MTEKQSRPHKVAILTSGGLAPCLSSAVGYLIEGYTRHLPSAKIICYLNGYRGLLLGESIEVTDKIRKQAPKLQNLGGSPIGNSRVRLKNAKDCQKRGLVKEGESPERVAALQLIKDEITILHTIGGDDTNMSAGDLSQYLKENFNNYKLSVIGLPKTIDNDVYPVSQTLGAQTAAEQSSTFFQNVVAEHSSNPGMLIVHEIMGRNSGWLAAKTALIYTMKNRHFLPDLVDRGKTSVHAVYIPEATFDLEEETKRLKSIMEKQGCVNIFLSEGSCSDVIIAEKKKQGEEIVKDAFGHVKLDTLNPGLWFSDVMAKKIGAEKVLVQKSGYFCRSAPANEFDKQLVRACAEKAVQFAIEGKTGLSGPDIEHNDEIRCISYSRVSGGKPFNLESKWLKMLMSQIGQRVIPLNLKQVRPFFSYEPTTTAGKYEENIDFEGLQETSRLVSIPTVSLVSVTTEESDSMTRLMQNAKIPPEAIPALGEIVFALMTCFKSVSASLHDVECTEGCSSFKNMANTLFTQSLKEVKSVKAVGSLDNTEFSSENSSGGYTVVLDPTDGSSNIDANVSVGSIFGIYSNDGDSEKSSEQNKFLKKGRELVASGYCLYSSATIMMITFGNGVFGFTLHPERNVFVQSHENVKIPPKDKFYSANEAYSNEWEHPIREFVDRCKSEKMTLRYIGTFVADIHRTLLFGGIFLYPGNKTHSNGKLKLLFELSPLANLIEQAGGRAVDMRSLEAILESEPAGISETKPIAIGSARMVSMLLDLIRQ